MSDTIIVNNLVMVYSDGTRAIGNISFSVKEGKFFGLLGPNGAGKSTTKILTTLLSAQAKKGSGRETSPSDRKCLTLATFLRTPPSFFMACIIWEGASHLRGKAGVSMKYEIRCSACKEPSPSLLAFKCPSCGQPLDTQLNFNFESDKIQRNNYSVWRYAQFFPYAQENKIVSLAEGWTSLVRFSGNTYVKLESANPTGSFKDRGATVLVSALHRLIEEAGGYISEDSSGNAGASMAAYAARAGLKARIYVPETVAGPKFNQIRFYGAQVTKVSGSRNRVAEEAQKVEKGKFYVGHMLHPLFRDGIRSLAYELFEQFGWNVPERIYIPVSAGTLLLGVISGFKHLSDSGVIEAFPKIVACQTRQVSPLYHRFKGLKYDVPETVTSFADALLSVEPPLLDLMVKSLKEVNGDAVMIEEHEIIEAFLELARRGFFVEPSSAVAYAAYKKQFMSDEVSEGNKVVIILTGNGLKTTIRPV